jgi:hypothetical protein
MVRWQRFKFGWHSRVLISKTIEGKSIFMEGRAPRAEVRRDRSQMRNTGRFRVSDCPSGPRPARFAETVRLRGAAHTLSTHLERPKYFNELLRGSRAAGRRQCLENAKFLEHRRSLCSALLPAQFARIRHANIDCQVKTGLRNQTERLETLPVENSRSRTVVVPTTKHLSIYASHSAAL